MSVKIDWQVPDHETRWELSPPPRPRGRWWPVLVGFIILGIAGGALYLAQLYRARLHEVSEPVRAAARLEAQAIANNDMAMFMALQDPDDVEWREIQAQRFEQLRTGLLEFGWQAMGRPPQPGEIALAPDSVQVDFRYYFSVTQPLPGGPVSLTLRVPHFYAQVPSGWVHVRQADAAFWGELRLAQDNRVRVFYFQRDADLIEPLVSQLGETVEQVCDTLPCPPQMTITFEAAAETLGRPPGYSFSEGTTLRLPAPHLLGLPADPNSRDEFYRALKIRVVQALVDRATDGRLQSGSVSAHMAMRWELARVGLSGPWLTGDLTRTLAAALQNGAWYPLETIRGREPASQLSQDTLTLLAFGFLEEHFGPGSIVRAALAGQPDESVSHLILTVFQADPAALAIEWWKYLRTQAGRPVGHVVPSSGELVLTCATRNLWHLRADGTGARRITSDGRDPVWSWDGRRLAFVQSTGLVAVVEADYRPVPLPASLTGTPGWLPDGRLWVTSPPYNAQLVHLETGQVITFTGTGHVWSPDGTRVAFLSWPNLALWIAEADGRDARQVQPGWRLTLEASGRVIGRAAPGYEIAWSHDGTKLAFTGLPWIEQPGMTIRYINAGILVADARGQSTLLVSESDLLDRLAGHPNHFEYISNLAWSPDGTQLAAGLYWPAGPGVALLDATTGAVRAQLGGDWSGAAWPPGRAWSPNGRYLVLAAQRFSSPSVLQLETIVVWDTQTGQATALPGGMWDWSPDGEWLAVTRPQGVWLIKPDMSAMHWLKLAACSNVAWKPLPPD